MLTFQGDIVEYDGDFIDYTAPTPPPDIYRVYCLGTHGSVSAVPDHGETGTEVTLYNYPDTGYEFVSYQMTGAYLKDANHFDIQDVNVTVSGCFQPVQPAPIPSYSIRVKFKPGYTPDMGDSQTLVDQANNIWDITKNATNWSWLFSNGDTYQGNDNLLEIIGSNTSGVKDFGGMCYACTSLTTVHSLDTSGADYFHVVFTKCTALKSVPVFNIPHVVSVNNLFDGCTALETVGGFTNSSNLDWTWGLFANCSSLKTAPLFDTSNVTDASMMFYNSGITSIPAYNTSKVKDFTYFCMFCESLTAIPQLNVSGAEDVRSMFALCRNVESGIYQMYQRLSSVSPVPEHQGEAYVIATFAECGVNTVTGAAELAQIPNEWKLPSVGA